MRRHRHLCLLLGLLLGTGCSGSKPESSATSVSPSKPLSASVSTNKADYPVFPDADAGADPSVLAERGGKGFTGDGWETNTNFDLIGDPRAVKGGVFREYTSDFPGTLRIQGPEWSSNTNYMFGELVYETLLKLDPATTEYIPSLATHWQISPDKMNYRFRIDPNARWSDGKPVIADDVVASWGFYTDKGANDPALYAEFSKFDKPVAESKYIVSVHSKSPEWKNFLNFVHTMLILPAHVLKDVDGKTYLKDYNFKYLPGTGPYIINESDINKGNSITVRRRTDYWAEKARRNVGLNNFDEVRVVVVRDPYLAVQMVKKGDLDFIDVLRSKDWVQEFNVERVQRGLIQKRKVFNNKPDGFQGFAINTRRAPVNDVRVRKALSLLFNREPMLEKLFYNEYLPTNSYYPGTVYENPDNPKARYDPREATALLAEAGWKTRDSQGRLTKDGKTLEIEMLYDNKQDETYLTVFQDDLRKVGITLNLRLVTFETAFKLVYGRQFDITIVKWGGLVFPDPEVMFHSRLAEVNDTDNITGFRDPRIDQICEKYGKTFDVSERIALIRELDGIMTNEYHYIFHWYPPAERLVYWNKFGQPLGVLTRIGDYQSGLSLGSSVEQLWWIDVDKAQKLSQAMADSSVKLDVGQTENRYWQQFGKTQQTEVSN